jgi:hypothetical protein
VEVLAERLIRPIFQDGPPWCHLFDTFVTLLKFKVNK